MNPRYARVAHRGLHRCEYCRAPEAIFNFPFEVEHIVPQLHGGSDQEANWALSCRACNLHKGDHVAALDPQTGSVVPLFHPRRHRWDEHFSVQEPTGLILGLSAIGRATIDRLLLNAPSQLNARREWMRIGLFPSL